MNGRNTNHSKCEESIELDQAVEVAEDDRNWQEHNIDRVAAEQPHELDHFGEAEHEYELGPERISPALRGPALGCLPAQGQEEWISHKGQGGERRDVQGVRAPRLLTIAEVRLSSSR